MRRDAFSQYHPLTNFLYFVGAIGFSVVFQHPAYMVAGCVAAASYYMMLNGKKGWKMILGMVPLFAVVAAINPLFNTDGETVLFTLFSKPYTFEALIYGIVVAGMLVGMMLWFGCYSIVLTSDKFFCLFGSFIPSISLLLVMVLRLIPSLMNKANQLSNARKSVGKGAGEHSSNKDKVTDGMNILSALTDWALEGSIVTADSMRSRGYGAEKRTSFQIYRLTGRDLILIIFMVFLASCVLLCGGTEASFTPELQLAAPTWGLAAYWIFLLIPPILYIQEAVKWHISISKI